MAFCSLSCICDYVIFKIENIEIKILTDPLHIWDLSIQDHELTLAISNYVLSTKNI